MSQPVPHGPFIASQKLLVLDAPPEFAMRCLSPGAYLTSVPSAEELQELNRRLPRGCAWQMVEDRIAFLADTSIKRLCFLVDAGVGKSTVLSQCAYVRQNLDELTDLPRHRTGHLVIDLPFTDLPTDCGEYLDDRPYHLAKRVQRTLKKKQQRVSRDEINPWLQSLALRGDLTLNIDALDQFRPTTSREPWTCRQELCQFLQLYPKVRIVTSGRPSAISSNDDDELFHPNLDEPQWTFAVICLFDDEQRAEFVGPERASKLEQAQIAPGELNVPRMLEAVRLIPVDQLADVRTASDIYWRALMTTIDPRPALPDTDTPQSQERQQVLSVIDEKYRPNPSRQLFLFSIIAFQLLLEGNTEGIEDEEEVNGFLKRIWDHRETAIKKVISKQFTDLDFERQMAVFMDLNKTSLEHAIVDGDIKRIKFQNRSFQNFFAALWCARWGDETDREWLLNHRTIRYTYPKDAKNAHDELYEFWKLLCEMPGKPIGRESKPNYREAKPARYDEVYCPMVSVLFENGPLDQLRDRPTEMIWRCWPSLVQMADQPLAPGWTEADVTAATEVLQREAWQSPLAGEGFGQACWTDVTARDIVMRFLSEFPRIARGEADWSCRGVIGRLFGAFGFLRNTRQAVARQFNEGFRLIPTGETWFSNEGWGDTQTSVHPQRFSVDDPFLLHAYPTTNEVYDLFDTRHQKRFRWYRQHSKGQRCPAIPVSWYDAACLAIWLHSRLPTELEWEHACRADPDGQKGPVDFWWSKAGESFEEARQRIADHAWVDENSRNRVHDVGAPGHANALEMCDMLGGVWEWTSSWGHVDSRKSLDGKDPSSARVLRGGSFLDNASDARCSSRDRLVPSSAYLNGGVRFARASFRKS